MRTASRAPGRPIDEEKDFAILAAAHELFLTKGFAATCMQEVAQRAEVSKVTLYKRFPDKLALFSASVRSAKCQMESSLNHVKLNSKSLGNMLTAYGMEILRFMMRSEYIAFERLLAQQAAKNPALAKEFFQAGPESCKLRLAKCIEAHPCGCKGRRAMEVAEVLLSLWLGYKWGAVRLSALRPLQGEELRTHVNKGVKTVLKILKT